MRESWIPPETKLAYQNRNWEFLCRNIKQVVLESISGQNKNSDRQKERFRSPIGIGVGVTIYTTVFLLKAKILLGFANIFAR